jgi:hypothetical protein
MTELIIKNDIGQKKMEDLLFFLKSKDIEAEIRPAPKTHKVKKGRIINKFHALSDEQLAEQLSGEVVDILSCSDNNWNEIIMRIPSFVNLDNIQHFIDLMVYKETIAHSQATQDDVDRIAKEAKKGWWLANRERFIK